MKISTVNNIAPDRRTFNPSDELLLNRRDIGIEIEAESVSTSTSAPQHWTITSDGSLRNHGVELVSSIVRGQDIVDALTNAEKYLTKAGATFTERTSVHIHLDVRHLDTKELIFFVTMYLLFEKFFFMRCGDMDRALNNHCRPIQSASNLGDLIQGLFSRDPGMVGRSLANWPKYSAMNIRPVIDQGSVEFRHHRGTCDKKELLLWINTIFALAAYVRKNKDKPLQEEIDKVCADGRGLFNSVFPRHKEHWCDEIHQGMIEGARYIQVPLNTRPLDSEREEALDENSLFRGLGDIPRGRTRPTPTPPPRRGVDRGTRREAVFNHSVMEELALVAQNNSAMEDALERLRRQMSETPDFEAEI